MGAMIARLALCVLGGFAQTVPNDSGTQLFFPVAQRMADYLFLCE